MKTMKKHEKQIKLFSNNIILMLVALSAKLNLEIPVALSINDEHLMFVPNKTNLNLAKQ